MILIHSPRLERDEGGGGQFALSRANRNSYATEDWFRGRAGMSITAVPFCPDGGRLPEELPTIPIGDSPGDMLNRGISQVPGSPLLWPVSPTFGATSTCYLALSLNRDP